jgi:uncharacterized protein (DUF2147 family)
MLRSLAVALVATLAFSAAALADPIEGNWRTDAGSTAQIADCGGAFCITLVSGEHSGKQIGRLSPNGANRYKGEITDPNNNKTYSGKARLSGNALEMSGCVFGGLICRNQNWQRL